MGVVDKDVEGIIISDTFEAAGDLSCLFDGGYGVTHIEELRSDDGGQRTEYVTDVKESDHR